MTLTEAVQKLETRHLRNYVENYEAGKVGAAWDRWTCAVACMTNPASATRRRGYDREYERKGYPEPLRSVETFYMYGEDGEGGGDRFTTEQARAARLQRLCLGEMERRENERNEGRHPVAEWLERVARSVGVLSVLVLLLGACTSVSETEHCVETMNGRVVNQKMGTGLNATFLTDATCFDMTEQNYPLEDGQKEVVAGVTSDRLNASVDLALTWEYDPATVFQVFKDKRDPARVEVELRNAIREGARGALAQVTVDDLLGPKRAEFGEAVAAQINRKLGSLATVKKVYVRNIIIPPAITQQQEARIAAMRQRETAVEQFRADSVKAFSRQYQAQIDADIRRMQAQVYDQNPALLRLEVAKAQAAICGKAATCILGQEVLAGWGTR